MTFYVTNQNTVIVMLAVAGLVFGFLWDILKVKRHFFKSMPVSLFLEDFLYCAVCTFLFHVLVFVTNYGYIRWYEFAACIVGFSIYRLLFESAVLKIMICTIQFIRGIVLRILGIVLLPFVKLFGLLKKAVFAYASKLSEYYQKKRMKLYSDSAVRKMLRLAENGFYRIKERE